MIFKYFKEIPKGVWLLGFVTLLMNIASVISITLTPLFLKNILGVNMTTLGVVQGVVEGTALVTRVFSGFISDWFAKRKIIITLGYSIAFLANGLLVITETIYGVFFSRLLDRFSNGIQASPRDALIGDLAPRSLRGTCYGLRQGLSVIGSCFGAVSSGILMWLTAQNYRFIFALAMIPIGLALGVLMFGVKENPKTNQEPRKHFRFDQLSTLSSSYWRLMFLNFVFMIGNLCSAFFIIQAQNLGVPTHWLPFLMAVQNLVTVFVAFSFGRISDLVNRKLLLGLGFFTLALSHGALGSAPGLGIMFLGVALYGVQIGINQSLLSVWVADLCPTHLRGTGFGIFHFLSGVALLLSNSLLGKIWDKHSPCAVFYTAATVSMVSLLSIPWLTPDSDREVSTKSL